MRAADCVVVGSGPTGVACASALLEAGRDVTLVDVGDTLEPRRSAQVATLANESADRIRATNQSMFGGSWRLGRNGFPLKLAFGSAYPYAQAAMAGLDQRGTRCVQSEAAGGLSTVWGAAMLPWRTKDLAHWPGPCRELAPHYAAVSRLLPPAAAADDLVDDFPLHGPHEPALEISSQASMVLERLTQNRAALKGAGVSFGKSRLAVRNRGPSACRRVGLCLTGCPHGSIWSATDTLAGFRDHPRFRYYDGVRVERIADGAKVTLSGRRISTGEPVVMEAARVFLGLGVLSTIRLVVTSLGVSDSLRLRYHPYFLAPVWLGTSNPTATTEPLHALAQIFLEIADSSLSEHPVHLQLYTYTPLFEDHLGPALSVLGPERSPLRRAFLGRLAAVQGYFHSSDAQPIDVIPQSDGRLVLSAPPASESRERVRRATAFLRRHASRLGFEPIPFASRPGFPGEGNHVGAVFPMRHDPGRLESDVLGRLGGWRRIHIVDASVLCDLPSATLTYTAMANAHRIGASAARLENPES
jgi:choline dehydrogenase-like flavoprotein